ncbi:hypothetical protein SAMN04487843_108107 [Methylobacterium sp. ap11]|uniref:hypothetical protein n=1 Tax=Methylobacterium sp. ap11 TaxID=1761799 RepID=UPI0008BFE83A|nr:hypothetical protein [Methylobacterium sp. ap11]SEP20075.1 hypothetical protein SAMN04487843_108107 [Methylobacterium sp. ap11]
MEDNDWNPTINAAHAAGHGRFCIALSELEYDDPFTAIVEYGDAFPQPWSRTDVLREIYAIKSAPVTDQSSSRFAALSNEGDVYWIGDQTVHETIQGAGIQSPDATGAGALANLGLIEGQLWAVGHGAQIYHRTADHQWVKMPFHSEPEPGFNVIRFGNIAGPSEDNFYIKGSLSPKRIDLDEKTRKSLKGNKSWDDWNRAHEIAEENSPSKGLVNEGRAYHWNGTRWTEIPIPGSSPHIIKDIYVETPDKVWMVGSHGTILVGNGRDGFRSIGFAGDTETLLSITRFKDQYVVASDYALHLFDGHHLTPFKPRLRGRARPTPLKVQSVDDVLYYFDYKRGIHCYDGERWTEIVIPPELRAREFKGLPPRSP